MTDDRQSPGVRFLDNDCTQIGRQSGFHFNPVDIQFHETVQIAHNLASIAQLLSQRVFAVEILNSPARHIQGRAIGHGRGIQQLFVCADPLIRVLPGLGAKVAAGSRIKHCRHAEMDAGALRDTGVGQPGPEMHMCINEPRQNVV